MLGLNSLLYYNKIMKKEDSSKECCNDFDLSKVCHGHHGHHGCHGGGCSNAIYGLGVVGALFYFLQGANTFVLVMTGIGKAFFWPAILMFKLLTYLQM